MNRKEKIKLLQNIATGKKTIESTFPPICRTWKQDLHDPEIFHYQDLTVRHNDKMPGTESGREYIDIFIFYKTPSTPSSFDAKEVTLNL